jgi:hypothetical protein
MDYEKLKSAAETITMPEEVKRRIVRNCKTQISNSRKEIVMKTNKNNTFMRKPAAVFVAVALCLSLSVTALAATGVLQGFFQDITDYRGAVVGTSYEQATDEISMDVTVNGDELTVMATFANPQMAPYSEAEKLGIAAYQVVDANGKVVAEGAAESTEIVNGQAAVNIKLDGIDRGSYKLIVTAFVTEKKADQPLNISGAWECAFTK